MLFVCRMNLVTNSQGDILTWESLGLPMYRNAARENGYTGEMLLSLNSAQIEEMAFHLGMAPGHRIQFCQRLPAYKEAVHQYLQRFHEAAAAQEKADALLRANGACPLGGLHEWQSHMAGGFVVKMCRKCFANA